ncbi:MAG: DEAD/DEAH box helicase [Gammaproteobacteria bacterium 39-13]|nr:DEAD/DEAH box helicase [Gammaproteobacteria bacterium]OJV95758.1 MAG: DEAD/DEAH box helicase [Gammaproteobacteria bacterium 39-13]
MSFSVLDSLDWAHPLVKEWFIQSLGYPTEPQQQGWPSILKGKTTLISAPTGSGKTLTAFLACLNELIVKAVNGRLCDETEVLYISPLKALGNDIQKNLMKPLHEITTLAKQHNIVLPDIRVAVRTGDTLAKERQKMLKNKPHILITTPESLYILLTAEKSRDMLKTVKTVIVDEIHAIARDKRGVHLTLSLERLEALTLQSPVRIGLSATQKPLTEIAHYLAGTNRPIPTIIDIGHARHLELSIEEPHLPLGAVASNEMWDEIYESLATIAKQNRSTLIFTNTRKLAERIAHHLSELIGEGLVSAHHGSLSRKLRLEAETKLKNGDLKALVATASLELGIDIGSIDVVCQIGSPRAIAAGLQRVGRSGHWHGAISKGRFFVTTRDELLECGALIHAIRQGELDQLIIPKESLDILAQQIVATCATGEWEEEALFKLIKGAYPYRELTRDNFEAIISILSEGIAGSRGRYGAYLYHDKVNKRIKGRRNSRLVAITSGGAIPETGLFTVIAEPDGMMVGTLDEDFAIESNSGDVILLGTTSWRVNRIESWKGRVIVEDAHGSAPSVPFWRGEAPARTEELSLYVSLLREKIESFLSDTSDQSLMAKEWLIQNCCMSDKAANQLITYLNEGRKVLGAIPTQKTLIAERFFDESGGMQLIIHSPFGAKINKAWGLALRKRFCRSFNFELQAAATDNGLNIALAEQHSFPLSDVFQFLHPNTIKEVLIQAVLQSPVFNTRWRWVATRSLSIVRFRNSKKLPPNILRILADDLLAAVFPDAAACQDNLGGKDVELPAHPFIDETMKDVLTEALDLEGLIELLKKIQNNTITCLAIDTPLPSVFSHEILNANPYAFLDDAPLEERRARAVEMRRVLPESVLKEVGKLDQNAIKLVQKQAWPDIRDADELHDLLQSLIAIPEEMLSEWRLHLEHLIKTNRVTSTKIKEKVFFVAAEKIKRVIAIYNNPHFDKKLVEIEKESPSQEEALVEMIRHWMLHLGPTTERELNEILNVDTSLISYSLLKLESSGMILRGRFRTSINDPLEWCERRLLSRIHRLTVEKLRKEIEPVTAEQFMNWLLKWQHVATGTQLQGEQGLIEIIHQLQGFEIPANAWETQIFKKRLQEYETYWLDNLCLSGRIGWGRLSLHPATLEDDKSIVPRSVAPITFFIREGSDWMPEDNHFATLEDLKSLSHVAKLIYDFLKQRGASFFAEIVRGVGRLQAEVESALWELSAAGVVTADGFDNLRALINPKRRADKRARRMQLHYGGRWTLLYHNHPVDPLVRIEAICWMLLKRYGIVFRDLIIREKNVPRWRDLLMMFRRLEDQGEIRGGHFIKGFIGEQFALPYAIDSLRATKRQPLAEELSTIAAADPLNLTGILFPGNRVSGFSNKTLFLKNGQFSVKP